MVEKLVEKRYHRNESLGLAWDRMEVCWVALFNTTEKTHPEKTYILGNGTSYILGGNLQSLKIK